MESNQSETSLTKDAPMSLWKAILLIIALVFVIVILFGVLIYLFIKSAQQMAWPSVANIAIFVIISGIFAWLIKRLTDIVSGLGRHWFPEDN